MRPGLLHHPACVQQESSGKSQQRGLSSGGQRSVRPRAGNVSSLAMETDVVPVPPCCGAWDVSEAMVPLPLPPQPAFGSFLHVLFLKCQMEGAFSSVFMVALAVMETRQAGAAEHQLCNCSLPLHRKHGF